MEPFATYRTLKGMRTDDFDEAAAWSAARGGDGPAAPERLTSIVEGILFEEDPIGINAETNVDEYRPEAQLIVEGFVRVHSEEELLAAIHRIFLHMFDESSAGPLERYESIARRVWDLRQAAIPGRKA
jgi:hypothetical protein